MEINAGRTLSALASSCAALWVASCGSGNDAVSVPAADAVVSAPVASLERPETVDDSDGDTPSNTEPTNTDPTETVEETVDLDTTAAADTTAAPPPDTAVAPPVTETPDDDIYLRLGDEGPEVASMQSKLASIDYISSDFESGVFDETTRQGLRRFQGDYGLGVDGIYGPLTERSLNAAVSSIASGT